jgi:hypothetical protein
MSDQEPQPETQTQEQQQEQEEPKEQKVVITYTTHKIVAKTRVPGKQIPKKIATVIQ